MLLDLVVGIGGVVVMLVIVSDVFMSVIVPRPTYGWRPSAVISRNGWRFVGAIGMRMNSEERREMLYGTYAPFLLVYLLIFWIAALTLGFGLIFFALRDHLRPVPQTYWGAVYYAGTSLLTLGYGDIVAHTGLTRAISLTAAAIGLATFSLVTAYLFALFAAFQRREAFIVNMRERTGAPPSGLDFLIRYLEMDMLHDLSPTFGRVEAWMADLMETHLAYPVLSYFRSTHDFQSWVGTIGAMMDAATLVLTTVDIGHEGAARMLSRLGRHLVVDYVSYYSFLHDPGAQPGIERSEFDQAYARLAAQGVQMHEREKAWREFAALRGTYAFELNQMAQWWRIPPALWIGDRSLIVPRHAPTAVVVRSGPK